MSNSIEEPKRKFEKVDVYTICICLFFLLASVGVLSKNYIFSGEEDHGNERIGQIASMKNQVRRKFDNGMIWYDTKESEVLYENDWIYTGEFSKTTIQFDDGGQLTLDPNSLIVLTRNRGMMKLELQHGSFVADLKKGTEISVVKNGKTEVIEVADQKIKVSDKSSQIAQLSPESKPQEEEFEGLDISIDDSFINLKSPLNDSVFFKNKGGLKLPLEWKASEGFKSFNIEISSEKEFKKPKSFVSEDHFTQQTLDFEGDVFWRVSAQARDGRVTSEIFHFTVKQNKAPLAKIPEDKKDILIKISKDQEGSIEFEWDDEGDIWPQYELEISSDPSFAEEKSITHDNLVGEVNRIPMSEKGTYFWRVRGKDETGEQVSNWSQPRSYNFNIQFHKELSSVQLDRKNIIYSLQNKDYKWIDSKKIVDLSQKKKKPVLSWKKIDSALFYKVEVSKKDNFKTLLQNIEVSENKASLTKSAMGKVYYRVTPQFGNGDTAPPAYGTLKTYLPAPSVITSQAKDKSFNLAWSASPAIDEYEVVYYDNSAKQDRQTLYFKSNEVKIKNTNGFLDWKVRAVSSKTKEPFSPFTSPQTIKNKVLASVPKEDAQAGSKFPKIVSPPKKKTFLTFDNNPTYVLMRWKYKEKYTKFELEVSTHPQMDFVLLNRKVTKKKTVIKKAFKPGKYYFRVRAINGGDLGDWSPVQVFRVIQDKAN